MFFHFEIEKNLPSVVLVCFLFLSLSEIGFAQTPADKKNHGDKSLLGQKIIVYQQGSSVEYRGDINSSTVCRMSFPDMIPANVLAENKEYLKLQFVGDRPVQGCNFRDSWIPSMTQNEGWIKKDEIYFTPELPDDEMITESIGDGLNITVKPKRKNSCGTKGSAKDSLADLIQSTIGIKKTCEKQTMKDTEGVDKYFACYPPASPGKENYPNIAEAIDLLADIFKVKFRDNHLAVNPVMMRCLIRRESQYDYKKVARTIGGDQGGIGLGQQVRINRKHQQNRLNAPNSWEKKLWDEFFRQAQLNPVTKKLADVCRSRQIASETDAKCPLNSLAAAGLDLLRIQQALAMTANDKNLKSATGEMDYNLAIATTYNLGIGDGSRAVAGKSVGQWGKALINKYQERGANRLKEGKSHMESLKNCMEQGNGNPMSGDRKRSCDIGDKPSSEMSSGSNEIGKKYPAVKAPKPPKRRF